MMWRWNLPGLWISMRPFIWQKIWVPPLGHGRVWPKNLKKKTKNCFFGLISWNFQYYIKTVIYVIVNIGLHYCSKFEKNLKAFGGVMAQKAPKNGTFWGSENIWALITWQPQMLWRWNFSGLCISIRPFILQNIWVSPLGCGRMWP